MKTCNRSQKTKQKLWSSLGDCIIPKATSSEEQLQRPHTARSPMQDLTLGSCPEPKADAQPLSHPGVPLFNLLLPFPPFKISCLPPYLFSELYILNTTPLSDRSYRYFALVRVYIFIFLTVVF